jgi:ferric-dicitrate binding protein FerR (iron transport regulator)
MNIAVCACTCLIEPWRDGLIDSAKRTLLEQHLRRGCEPCQAQIRYLDWVVEELRARAPIVDELSLQRRRMPALVQAAQQRQRGLALGQQRLGAVKGALAVALALGIGLVLLDRSPRVRVARISGGGEVRRFTEGDRSVVQLSDGRYELQVSRGFLDRSLVVRLPDGEIEDLGTAFGVTVEDGRTSHVAVTEGVVQLRLHGAPGLRLEAGSAWDPPPAAHQEVAPVPQPPEPEPEPDAISPALGPQPTAAHAKPAKHNAHTSAAGDNTEDAMYLRMLDLLRADRKDAARGLALRYLKEFPAGFRRAEVLRISQSKD